MIIPNRAKRRKACIKKHFQKSTISKYEMNLGEKIFIFHCLAKNPKLKIKSELKSLSGYLDVYLKNSSLNFESSIDFM